MGRFHPRRRRQFERLVPSAAGLRQTLQHPAHRPARPRALGHAEGSGAGRARRARDLHVPQAGPRRGRGARPSRAAPVPLRRAVAGHHHHPRDRRDRQQLCAVDDPGRRRAEARCARPLPVAHGRPVQTDDPLHDAVPDLRLPDHAAPGAPQLAPDLHQQRAE